MVRASHLHAPGGREQSRSHAARTSSEDSETNQRHLVRVHLEHKDQPLPADVREVFDKINAGEADEWPQEAWDSVDRSGDPKSHLK